MTDTTPAEATDTAEAAPSVKLGDTVTYILSESDVLAINAADPAGGHRNPVHANREYAAVVTAVWSPDCVNLRVYLDGAGHGSDYWATSRVRGTEPNTWHA